VPQKEAKRSLKGWMIIARRIIASGMVSGMKGTEIASMAGSSGT
jgi:hypothetical protein